MMTAEDHASYHEIARQLSMARHEMPVVPVFACTRLGVVRRDLELMSYGSKLWLKAERIRERLFHRAMDRLYKRH